MVVRTNLRHEKETLLMTLYLRALDNRARSPILGDGYAQGLVDQIDYDFHRLRNLKGNVALIASRARTFDVWTRDFLTEYPEGQVLNLACGLDSRPLRVPRPQTARWIDVDYPEVLQIRDTLYGSLAGVDTIAASVDDPALWAQVPTDRPTFVLAEGLFMYLSDNQVHRLIDRIITHLPSGRLAFDGIAPWVKAIVGAHPSFRRADARFASALAAPIDLARAHPPLQLLKECSATGLIAEYQHRSLARTAIRGLARIPGMRDAMRVVEYRMPAAEPRS